MLEGIAYAHRHALDALQDTVGTISSLQLTGGGGGSPLWAQILADVTGLPVSVPTSRESTALGASVMAGVAAGVFSDPASAIQAMGLPERRVEPGKDAAVYADGYRAYLNLVSQMEATSTGR